MTPATPPPQIELHAWAELGLSAQVAERPEPAISLDLARAQVRYTEDHHGGMLQVDASGGIVTLLDAVGWVGSRDRVTVQAGLFKTPLSLDFATPAPKLILPTRALLVSAATKRDLGAEVQVHLGDSTLHLGAFDPVSDLLVTGPGIRPIAAADLALPAHLTLHLAATTWVRDLDVAAELPAEIAPGWDHEADLGVGFEHADTTLSIEGLVAHPAAGGTAEGGVGALAAHRFPAGSVQLEPGLGLDAVNLGGDLIERATGALNLHQEDWHMVTSLSWEESFLPTGRQHLARLQLQTGF